MVYTSEFILLDKKVRGCQNKETVQECEAKKYLDNMMNTCNCTPYHLINGSKNVSKVLGAFYMVFINPDNNKVFSKLFTMGANHNIKST